MIDEILTARLDALEQDLKHAQEPKEWKTKIDLKNVYVADKLWEYFNMDINNGVEACFTKIEVIRKKIEDAKKDANTADAILTEAWSDYREVYEDSECVFHECLDFFGGLALRSQQMGESICQVADEIIINCADLTRVWPSLTVPATRESLTKTLGRIVRLRFPVWTIWTLPFIAHEYGHVVVDENKGLNDFAQSVLTAWLNEDPQLKAMTKGSPEYGVAEARAKKRNEYHLSELMADAFATHTMGPAYACAGILLRFNPSVSSDPDDKNPGDAKRAHVVISTLRKLNSKASGNPYKDIIEELDNKWKASLALVKPTGALAGDDEKRLNDLVDELEGKDGGRGSFDSSLTPSARYPHGGGEEGGWLAAQGWALEWWEAWKRNKTADPHKLEVSRNSRLRDALNVAWLCRRFDGSENAISAIANTTLNLSQKIIQENRKQQDLYRPPSR